MGDYHALLKQQMKEIFADDSFKELDPKIVTLLESINKTFFKSEENPIVCEDSGDSDSVTNDECKKRIEQLQVQLVTNDKMASIGQLSAGIAHEINNPLGYVQSNVEIMKKYTAKIQGLYQVNKRMLNETEELTISEYQDRFKEANNYIKSNKLEYIFNDLDEIINETLSGIQRIEKIVRSLLGFSRKGSENEYVEYDVNAGIKDTLTIATNEIKYYANVVENLEPVSVIYALSGEINQVLLNLIVNAAHAVKSKGVQGNININTYSDDEYVYCEISDDGVGIPHSQLEKIFEPFFTTKPLGTGTGLGLSIAHDIIEIKHKGKIDVKSELGIGTTFKISLPINKDAEQIRADND